MIDGFVQPVASRSSFPFVVGLSGNMALAVLKLTFGVSGHSNLVLMDGLFSFLTASVLLLAWQADVLERRGHDERYPYGPGKILFMSMAVVGLLALVIGLHMMVMSVYGLWRAGQSDVSRSYIELIMITLVSIAGNVLLWRYLLDRGWGRSKVLLGLAARYNRIDMWISVFALHLLILALFGLVHLERFGVAVICIIVLVLGVRLLYASLGGIMDHAPSQDVLLRIRSCLDTIDEVKDVVDIKARHVGTFLHIEVWVAIDDQINMGQAEAITLAVEKRLMELMPHVREVSVIIA